MARPRAGGGWPAILYTFKKAAEAGPFRLWKRMRSKNACKTCALGMGGQKGGMVNEAGHFPEVCKKSLQAQVADMQGAIEPNFFDRNDLNKLLALTPKQAEDAGRVVFPLVHHEGGTHFRPVAMDAALDAIATALKQTDPRRVAFYSSGRSSNEAAFLMQSFARIYGTNHVMNCSYYCHQASGVGLKMTLGIATATVELDDLARCDLVVLIGANPASNHPRLMTQLADLKSRGGHVIVINPIRERGLEKFHVPSRPMSLLFGSDIASQYVQPLAGGDLALLVGVLKVLIEDSLVQHEFLKANTSGSQAVLEDAANADWNQLVASSGVSKEEIQSVARAIASAKACIFAWAMGLTHHTDGVGTILALCNVALATAQVGKPGAGLLPIRGHSNVQGIGSVGVAPALQPAVKLALEKAYGVSLPEHTGLDTYSMIEQCDKGEIDVLFALGGNLWGSNPDSDLATRAMQKVGTTVYLSTKLNPGHFHGRARNTIILPVLARDEEPQSTTQESMFNFVRLSEGGSQNVEGQMRSEAHIICDLATRVLGTTPVDWKTLTDMDAVRKLIAQTVPGWSAIENIGSTGREFTVAGRVFHTPQFPLPEGKAQMHRTPLPTLSNDLRLITLRSEGQFNTVVYEEYDLYRGIPHRFCILMAAADVNRMGLKDGQRVTVRGEAGKLSNIEVVTGNIRAGVAAMYYPEANCLLRANVDERSRTPAFKSAPVWIDV
ncbi:MAG: FdhF/YdeP family oxidoreductase [Candidatus Obscuribacterales bacterium]|nr:FdhF/YdeP family oxidoreductase [Candidatus Obscuribacterales bacterium]